MIGNGSFANPAPTGEMVEKWFGRYFDWRRTRGFVVRASRPPSSNVRY
jgi:hypothetical protein